MSLLRKIALGAGVGIGLLGVAGLVTIWSVGAWNLVFPSHHHDRVAPEIPDSFGRNAETRVLVFSKTNSYRHEDGIPAARVLFDEIAARRGWAVYHSENGALFDPEHLARFDAVVFSNASGDMLSEVQERAFRGWLEQGGGWLGIHSAGDASHRDWRWYQETLIGSPFTAHIMGPQTQEARVVVEDRNHAATRQLPAEFTHAEEWYSWEESARAKGFEVLLSVDESTYEPWARGFGAEKDLRMGDHPVVWWRCVGRGRALYSAMGHWGEAYAHPPHATLLEDALAWVAGLDGEGCREAAP
jgi:type 1 glutamine amidotransferase